MCGTWAVWGSYPSGTAVRGCRVRAHGFALRCRLYDGGGEWLTQPTDPGAGQEVGCFSWPLAGAAHVHRLLHTGARTLGYASHRISQATPSAVRMKGLVPRDHVAGTGNTRTPFFSELLS